MAEMDPTPECCRPKDDNNIVELVFGAVRLVNAKERPQHFQTVELREDLRQSFNFPLCLSVATHTSPTLRNVAVLCTVVGRICRRTSARKIQSDAVNDHTEARPSADPSEPPDAQQFPSLKTHCDVLTTHAVPRCLH